ncbi:MAG: helicase-exonuclease AddAB subunit AddB [Defluviitaleaceae bacterium]|nr:helicase-exonuclease AddAB subunit AddB [Defluviitaleaceae bacterium]
MIHIHIRYILGLPGSGKTTRCLNEIASAQEYFGNNSLIYLVPEQYSLQSERNLIAATANGAISRAQVLSFRRLAYFVFGKTGGVGRRILEENGKYMMLKKVLIDCAPRLRYFAKTADKAGFVDKLSASISEFFHYNINPDDIQSDDPAVARKLEDLRLIYNTYIQYLENEYISQDEILDILSEKLADADFLADSHIWVDGFKSFTPQERAVLAALIPKAAQITVSIVLDTDKIDESRATDAFAEMRDTVIRINDLGKSLGAKIDPPIFLDKNHRFKNAPDLDFLCRNFLNFEQDTYSVKNPNIRLVACDNIYSEIHSAAKMVLHLLRDRGYRYSDIGIVCTDLEKYGTTLAGIFSQYQIPTFVDMRRVVLGHPLPELIRAALDIVSKNWQYEAVFKLLKTNLLPIDRQDVDELENYVLANGVRGNKWKRNFDGNNFNSDKLNEIRTRICNIMSPLVDQVGAGRHSILEIAKVVYHFLEENEIRQSMQKWADEARLIGDNARLRAHEQIWVKISQTFEKIVEILGDKKFTLSEFSKILTAGFEGSELALAPSSLDQLVVGDMRRSRFAALKALICLGATEGAMPAIPGQTGLLEDADRAALSTPALLREPLAKILEEDFLVYASFAMPAEFLAISYPLGDLSGKANSPAKILNRITELIPAVSTINADKIPPTSLANISSPAQTYSRIVELIRSYSDSNINLPGIYLDSIRHLMSNKNYRKKIVEIRDRMDYFSKKDNLSQLSLENLYGKKLRASISKIEKYAECPFAYFLRYNLNLRQRKLFEVATTDFGNIFHDIMDNFAKKIATNLDKLNREQIHAAACAAVQEAIESPNNAILAASGQYAHFARRLQEIAIASTAAMAEHLRRGEFAILENEISFFEIGDDTSFVDIQLENGASMGLEGRIDRVDIMEKNGESFVKIIDYKSGTAVFSLSEVFYGIQLQLLIYLGAFIEKFRKLKGANYVQNIFPAAIFYFNLANPMVNFNKNLLDNPEYLTATLLKEFRMSGILLDEKEIFYAMDANNSGDSTIIPAGLKIDGEFTKRSMVVSRAGFDALIRHSLDKARDYGNDIISGRIPIAPATHKTRHSCRFCDYRSVCRFDETQQDGLRRLSPLSTEEVFIRMNGGQK